MHAQAPMFQVNAEWEGTVWKLHVPDVLPGVIAEAGDPAHAGEIAAAAVAGALGLPRASFSVFLTASPSDVASWAATWRSDQPSATTRRGTNVAIARSDAMEAAIVAGLTP